MRSKKTVISVYPSMKEMGGAEKIMLALSNELELHSNSLISTPDQMEFATSTLNIAPNKFIPLNLKNIAQFQNSIIISHHRKITSIFYWLIKLKILKSRLIHIAHSEFHNLKYASYFPNEIIAVSSAVKTNLVEYFDIDARKIKVIRNGVKDAQLSEKQLNRNRIRIVYPARINSLKNQLGTVLLLKDILPANIVIIFAGDGPQLEQLRSLTKNDERFEVLGYLEKMDDLYRTCDFVMLNSFKEGLPISLIEATMHGKPVICSNVGGNKEIVQTNFNGFIFNNDRSLIEIIKNINNISDQTYYEMSKNSRRVYNENFQYDTMIDRYCDAVLGMQREST